MLDILPGKKTYVVAAGAIAYAVGAWITGNMVMADMIHYLFMGAGAAALRKAIACLVDVSKRSTLDYESKYNSGNRNKSSRKS